ncbi:MAG: transposase, partial [Rhizobiaceae bacterium]|nr:transposase [Rhizobiaceae bacterium]
MPNHVHLVLVPHDEDGLRRALGEAHRRYTNHINSRENWRGHLWQERFHSYPMDETHLLEAVRYIELNPVRAGLAKHARDWRWSSARAHLDGSDDGLVSAQ